jgi:succinate dehydrogenase / fumarate reductase iron-sulfur subunit
MQIHLEIQRFDPEKDVRPYFQTFTVEAAPTDRLLDALMDVKRHQDGSLTFRKSCAHGVCGSDAMRINGRDRLACKTLIRDVAAADGDTVRIEPLRHFPLQRDLQVDQRSFIEKYKSVQPFLINDEPVEAGERLQSPEERRRIDDQANCILCAACYSACPVMGENPAFLGPAAIVAAARFLDDSRDRGFEARLPVLDTPDGVWPCLNHFECTRCCPREIKVTKRINETKAKIKRHRTDRGEPVHDRTS